MMLLHEVVSISETGLLDRYRLSKRQGRFKLEKQAFVEIKDKMSSVLDSMWRSDCVTNVFRLHSFLTFIHSLLYAIRVTFHVVFDVVEKRTP